jgi:hypothetical protein
MPPFAAKFYPPEELNYLALKKELDNLTSNDIPRLDLLTKLRNSHDKYIKALIRKYGLRNVVGGTRNLLVARVFKHRAAAERKFSHSVFFTDCESEAEEALNNGSVTVRATRNRPRPKGSGTLQGRLDFWRKYSPRSLLPFPGRVAHVVIAHLSSPSLQPHIVSATWL